MVIRYLVARLTRAGRGLKLQGSVIERSQAWVARLTRAGRGLKQT